MEQTGDRPEREEERSTREEPASVARWLQDAERQLAQFAPARMSLAVPRALDFLVRSWWDWWSGIDADHLPGPVASVNVAAQAALDEAVLLAAMGPSRMPRRADYERVGAELRAIAEFHRRHGFLDDPASYHRTPPPLEDPLGIAETTLTGTSYQRLSFHSGWEPLPGQPGGDRWKGYYPNQIAHAWLLRHEGDEPRPWLVCFHGFGMGYATMDLPAVRAEHLHHDLGYNVIMPVLPLHGARKVSPFSGEVFLSIDLGNAVLGMAQAMWDVRRLIGWIRSQDPVSIGVYGVSLGGYCAALLAGIEKGLDTVLCGIPVTDLPGLFALHAPPKVRERAEQHDLFGTETEAAFRPVSPLTFDPLVAPDRRFLYAGVGDRMARPEQARRLLRHWGGPKMLWYHGNHVGYLLSPSVRQWVDEVFTRPEAP